MDAEHRKCFASVFFSARKKLIKYVHEAVYRLFVLKRFGKQDE